MKVIDLLKDDFDIACQDLSQQVIDSSFTPNIIIGVLTGGGVVGREVNRNLSRIYGTLYFELKIQREGSKRKGGEAFTTLLKRIPRGILNLLRIIESKYLLYKSKIVKPRRVGEIVFSNDISLQLERGGNNILLVDDAIDSGATLKLISDYINNNYNNNNIRIAVITVTNKRTMIDADFYLYNDRTLIRFPWSNDI